MFFDTVQPSLFVCDCCLTEVCHLLKKCCNRYPPVIVTDVSNLSTLMVLRKHPDS